MKERDSASDSERIYAFIEEAELLKRQERTAWTADGKRESVGEHSWRVALLVFAIEEQLSELDIAKLLRMAIVHDLGEAYDGDTSAAEAAAGRNSANEKEQTERSGVERLTEMLPEGARARIRSAWEEYARGESPEARAVKALDKIETIIQHNQGANPADFDYRFNLEYGRKWADAHAAIRSLREVADQKTAERSRR